MSDKPRRLIVISDCTRECPFIETAHTPFGTDYFCTKVGTKAKRRKIVGYIEWNGELPKHGAFPEWCPLQEAEPGMYLEPKKD